MVADAGARRDGDVQAVTVTDACAERGVRRKSQRGATRVGLVAEVYGVNPARGKILATPRAEEACGVVGAAVADLPGDGDRAPRRGDGRTRRVGNDQIGQTESDGHRLDIVGPVAIPLLLIDIGNE